MLDDVVVAVVVVLDADEPVELPVDDEPVSVAEAVADPDEELLVADVLFELPVIEEPIELAVVVEFDPDEDTAELAAIDAALLVEEADVKAASLAVAIAKSMPISTRLLLKIMALK